MNPSRKGITLAVLQLALVASLGAKYALDRVRLPRVWAQTVAYDPDLPIRGRYLSVRVRVDAHQVYGGAEPPKGSPVNSWSDQRDVRLRAEGGHLVAYTAPQPTGLRVTNWRTRRTRRPKRRRQARPKTVWPKSAKPSPKAPIH